MVPTKAGNHMEGTGPFTSVPPKSNKINMNFTYFTWSFAAPNCVASKHLQARNIRNITLSKCMAFWSLLGQFCGVSSFSSLDPALDRVVVSPFRNCRTDFFEWGLKRKWLIPLFRQVTHDLLRPCGTGSNIIQSKSRKDGKVPIPPGHGSINTIRTPFL